MDSNNNPTPHVIIFPLPVQGHIALMLNLSELLCLAKFNVTFLIANHLYERLIKCTDKEARFARYPGFKFKVIPDGLPQKKVVPRQGGLTNWLTGAVQDLEVNAKRLLEEMVHEATCLVVDGWLWFAYDVANDAGLPVISFRNPSACCVWINLCTPELFEQGKIPFQDEDMDELVENIPGMESFLRYRDLPSFYRTKDKSTLQALQHSFTAEKQGTLQAHSLILNTFEELDRPILSQLRSQCSKVYSIGPLHAHIKHKLSQENDTTSTFHSPSSSLLEVDDNCLTWLDQKPDKSVVYVNFGRLTILKREQIMEIWEGLVQTEKFFLWVTRPELIIPGENESETPSAILEGTKKRGCIVSSASQEVVLAHRAVGGFLTHCGWNMAIESITAGVPLLCWPYSADQLVNSRFVSEVWKIGLDMKDTCDRNIVATMVNDLLDGKKDELARATARMSEAAKRSVKGGGSSSSNLESLIEDIKRMSLKGTSGVSSF